jgi:uncharacterized SAM-binding protein YcdF (DUF218 family)
MLTVESRSGEKAKAPSPGTRPRRGSRMRRIAFVSAICAAVALGVVLAGFVWFIWRLPAEEIVLNRNADGIVALTGGSSRVIDAIELLASGRGQRLLITGVHRATGPGELSRLTPEYQRIVRCCVDLDRSAVNTLGNAVGTRRWANERGFRSLIVVTSNYHMPRAIAELSHQLPGVSLIQFPVVSDKLRTEPWWSSVATVRLLFSEYLKYLAAMGRMLVVPAGAEAATGLSELSEPARPTGAEIC